MPIVKGDYDLQTGVMVPVMIAHSYSKQQPIECTAILDTGASATSISPDLADALKLNFSRKIAVQTAAGTVMTPEYFFRVYLPEFSSGRGGEQGKWSFIGHVNGRAFAGAQDLDVLIGLDIISQGTLKMTPGRHFEFSIDPP